MQVIIHQVPDADAFDAPSREAPGLFAIAGRPLILRQIEWLRATGARRVAVEVEEGPSGRALASLLDNSFGLGRSLAVVSSERLIGAREIARRADFNDEKPIVAIPADLVGDGDLRLVVRAANRYGAIALFEPPTALRQMARGTVRVMRSAPGAGWEATVVGAPGVGPAMVRGPGWAVRVQTSKDALLVGAAVLGDRLPAAGGAHAFPLTGGPKTHRSGVYVKTDASQGAPPKRASEG